MLGARLLLASTARTCQLLGKRLPVLCTAPVRLLANKPQELKAKFVSDDPRMPLTQRLKNLFLLYGPTAVVLHIGLSLTFLGVTYTIVRFGLDVPALLAKVHYLNEKDMMIIANGGTFGLAYALYKAMMPLRILVTLMLTPPVARKLQAAGIIKRKF